MRCDIYTKMCRKVKDHSNSNSNRYSKAMDQSSIDRSFITEHIDDLDIVHKVRKRELLADKKKESYFIVY